MADMEMAPAVDEGQAAETVAPEAPTETEGQATADHSQDQGTTASAPPQDSENSFFDHKELPEELKPAYKNMQKAFTKKMTALSKDRQKIEAYEAFNQNPVESIRQMATRYGMQVVPANGGNQAQSQSEEIDENWVPRSYSELLSKAQQMAERNATQKIMQQMHPYLQHVQQMQASTIENQLTEIDPEWRAYEDDMRANLKAHPTLVRDPATLYRLSVPSDVMEARAAQKAMKKLQAKTGNARVGTKSSVGKTGSSSREVKSFQDAVNIAKEQLAGK